ncbi:MAG: flagellar hook-basal body complex protein, partial [Desulfatiglandales bacterium]
APANESVTGVELTWNAGAWTCTNDGGFTGGIIIGGTDTATEVDLRLGGSGNDDITVTLTGAGATVNGETVTLDIDGDNWRVSNVPGTYTLVNGTDVGGTAAGVFTLDLNSGGTDITVDTAGTSPLDAVSFHIKLGNWTCTAVPAAYTGLDAADEITGTRTGYALNLGNPAGNDLTVSLAANAAEGDQVSLTITSSDNWATTTPNTSGYLVFQPDFLGGAATSMDIELDIGSGYNTSSSSWVNDSLSTSQYSAASSTIFQSANGYGAGDLQSVDVGTDGSITGQYSNGQVIPLYRVALAKFQNNQGLFKIGGNLFRETRLSGYPITGKPGASGLGNLSPNSLEQSNVDIATEFVKMITTQRGFQANSKIITVTDQMLAELINLKR